MVRTVGRGPGPRVCGDFRHARAHSALKWRLALCSYPRAGLPSALHAIEEKMEGPKPLKANAQLTMAFSPTTVLPPLRPLGEVPRGGENGQAAWNGSAPRESSRPRRKFGETMKRTATTLRRRVEWKDLHMSQEEQDRIACLWRLALLEESYRTMISQCEARVHAAFAMS